MLGDFIDPNCWEKQVSTVLSRNFCRAEIWELLSWGGVGSWYLTRLQSNVSGHCDYLKACPRLEALLPGWFLRVAAGRRPRFPVSLEAT